MKKPASKQPAKKPSAKISSSKAKTPQQKRSPKAKAAKIANPALGRPASKNAKPKKSKGESEDLGYVDVVGFNPPSETCSEIFDFDEEEQLERDYEARAGRAPGRPLVFF